MAGSNTFGGTLKLQGESEYRKAITQITQQLKVMGSEMSKVTAEFGRNNTSTESLTQRNKILNQQIEQQKEKVATLKGALEDSQKEYGENSKQANSWQISLNKAEAELISMTSELDRNSNAIKTNEQNEKTLSNSYSVLTKSIEGQKNKLEDLKKKYKNVVLEQGKNSKEAKDLRKEIKTLNGELNDNESRLNSAEQGLEEFENQENSTEKSTLSLGDVIKGNLISAGMIAGIKALANGMKELASKVGEVAKESLNARGELEQQVGGIETLFKDSSNKVIENANKAYGTAGLSAVDYMSTATSFSASLLQSLGNDTEKVAETTDMAIIDMSDNANKMGTSMESIQNAYQGFAKQNYTMLDNLKLGYGGTKTEMQRLLTDAQKVTGVKYDINNLNDVYQAIHVIQGELGITGTTAKEATETLQGSMSGMKGAWQNFLSGSGNLGQVTEAVSTVVENVIKIAKEAIPQLIGDIKTSLPQMLELGKNILHTITDGIQEYLPELINVAIDIVNSLLEDLIEIAPDLINAGVEAIVQLASGITKALPDLIPKAIDAIITIVDGLLDNIDELIDAGIELIMGLADGLIEALPQLIEKVPEIIDKLINKITDNLPKIIESGITLIVKLAEGLIKALPQLIEKIPEIITSLEEGFKKFWSSMGDIGKNLVEGIWEGIKNAKDWLWGKIKDWCGSLVDGIKGFFGIHSPSKVFKDEVGKFMAEGIGIGFSDEMSNVAKNMQEAIPTKFNINSSLNGLQENNSFMNFKDAFIESFREFKPMIILNEREVGEFAFEYGNLKYGKYFN